MHVNNVYLVFVKKKWKSRNITLNCIVCKIVYKSGEDKCIFQWRHTMSVPSESLLIYDTATTDLLGSSTCSKNEEDIDDFVPQAGDESGAIKPW